MKLSQNDSTVEVIVEGHFGGHFGPRFDILTGGQGAALGAMLDWLSKQKRKKKGKKKTDLYLVPRVMGVLDLLKLLRSLDMVVDGSAS